MIRPTALLVASLSLLTPALGIKCCKDGSLKSLKHYLSEDAVILFPGSPEYANLTTRWSAGYQPGIAAVVKVATEGDVAETVKYARACQYPLLFRGSGHVANEHIEGAKGAIQISMQGMTSITINEDGKSATLVGPVEAGQLQPRLWDAGKETTVTGCDCVALFSPMLGGGHGFHQGRYGLVSDQMISARLVLSSGQIITVSETEHPDLFWALRGAGHNFGIVVSVQYRIYDRKPENDNWAIEEFFFHEDKLESIYEIFNGWLPREGYTPPVELTHWSNFLRDASLDPPESVVRVQVVWQGTAVPATYSAPINALGPLRKTVQVVQTPTLNSIIGVGYGQPLCDHKGYRLLTPASVETYNTTALRNAFNILAAAPSNLANSVMLLEGYSTAAYRAVPWDSTAYPDRFNNMLLSPVILADSADPETVAQGEALGEAIRNAFVEGSGKPLYAYINYASGTESPEAIYGYEEWRLTKLRALKQVYDPENVFRFFNPFD